jgi:hypothetical protein
LIAVVALLHLMAASVGFSPWGCLLHDISGVPCPGCGLTTASLHFMHGEWRAGFQSHAFAPVFLLGIAALFAAAFAPAALRRAAISRMTEWEQRTGGGMFFAGALLAYWIFRVF